MSKSGKKSEGADTHVVKADVRHKYEVTELADFTRREMQPDGSEKLMPRVAVLTPVDGGKQVRAYVPGNLEDPVEVGCLVMCRPSDQKGKSDGPPVKFRITNVVGRGSAGETLTTAQNVQLGADAGAKAASDRREGAAHRG